MQSIKIFAPVALLALLALLVLTPFVFAEDGTDTGDTSVQTFDDDGDGNVEDEDHEEGVEEEDESEVGDEEGGDTIDRFESLMEKHRERIEAMQARMETKQTGMQERYEEKSQKYSSRMEELMAKMQERLGVFRANTGAGVPTVPAKSLTVEEALCVAEQVETREDSLQEAVSAFNDAVEQGLDDRKDALVAGWNMEDADERQEAIKSVWETWKDEHKTAFADLKEARNDTWSTFRTKVKGVCGTAVPEDEVPGGDTSGVVAL